MELSTAVQLKPDQYISRVMLSANISYHSNQFLTFIHNYFATCKYLWECIMQLTLFCIERFKKKKMFTLILNILNLKLQIAFQSSYWTCLHSVHFQNLCFPYIICYCQQKQITVTWWTYIVISDCLHGCTVIHRTKGWSQICYLCICLFVRNWRLQCINVWLAAFLYILIRTHQGIDPSQLYLVETILL